ncbi:hypothetical protein ACFLV0_03615 [Chloroflexota bacterium]
MERAVSAGDAKQIREKLSQMYGFPPKSAADDIPPMGKAVDKGATLG